MTTCPYCRITYYEPEDEQKDHNCPKCNRHWLDDEFELVYSDEDS